MYGERTLSGELLGPEKHDECGEAGEQRGGTHEGDEGGVEGDDDAFACCVVVVVEPAPYVEGVEEEGVVPAHEVGGLDGGPASMVDLGGDKRGTGCGGGDARARLLRRG